MGARRTAPSKARMLLIALAIGSAGLVAGETIRLGRTLPPPPPPAPCLLLDGPGYRALDYVDNLETCGARLEAVHLMEGRPVSGAFGGLKVFADDQGMDAAAGRGPRQRLVNAAARQTIDADIRRLLDARRRKGVIALDTGPLS